MVEIAEGDMKEMVDLLRELVKWSRFESVPRLRSVLEANLPGDKEKLIYELSDGEHSTRDIAKSAGVSPATVSNYWDKWGKLRIVEKSGTREGRSKRICSLGEVGLNVPVTANIEPAPKKENSGSQAGGNDVTRQ